MLFRRFDLIDISRQALANSVSLMYKLAVKSFGEKDRPGFVQYSGIFMNLLQDLDKVLSTDPHFMLGPWLESAKSLGANDEQKKLLEFNARNQVPRVELFA